MTAQKRSRSEWPRSSPGEIAGRMTSDSLSEGFRKAQRTSCFLSSYSTGGDKLIGPVPLFHRPALGQRAQFAQPDLAQENDRDIGAAQTFRAAIGNCPLPLLRDVVLNVYQVRTLSDIVHADLPCERAHGHLIGGRQLGDHLVSLPLPFPQTFGGFTAHVS